MNFHILLINFLYIQIPTGYKYSTILVASNNVTSAMYKFGEVLRRVKESRLQKNRL